MARADALSATDLEWEDPPSRGRGATGESTELIQQIASMVPALRERIGCWAVAEVYAKPEMASRKAVMLRKHFGARKTVESRLQFRAARMLEGGSKLYVRLLKAKD